MLTWLVRSSHCRSQLLPPPSPPPPRPPPPSSPQEIRRDLLRWLPPPVRRGNKVWGNYSYIKKCLFDRRVSAALSSLLIVHSLSALSTAKNSRAIPVKNKIAHQYQRQRAKISLSPARRRRQTFVVLFLLAARSPAAGGSH